jgi:hypothetical protein
MTQELIYLVLYLVKSRAFTCLKITDSYAQSKLKVTST